MRGVFYFIVIISMIFFIIKVLFSKEKTLLKVIITLLLFAILSITVLYVVVDGWEAGRRPVLKDETEMPVKSIYFKNESNQPISIIVNFKYLKNEIHDNQNIKALFNKIDTIYNLRSKQNKSFQTPIFFNSDVVFPEGFYVKVNDSTGRTMITFNKNIFFKNIENPGAKSTQDLEKKSSSWTLVLK